MSTDAVESQPDHPLRSRFTENFPALLQSLGVSVAVTTYQAGKLVLLRAEDGKVNTHFRDFHRPMGMAGDGHRLSIGTATEIRHYRNMRAACRHLVPPGRHDACFMDRSSHVTGDIDVHEMTWVGDTLWFVNTRFACLCTLDGVHSFVPRWRPPFISAMAPEDRCHLNGLWLEGKGESPTGFVTVLAETDTAQGWRDHKRDGGAVLEVPSGEVIVRGLSMPHSPRLYRDRLWVLESGRGGFGFVDRAKGRYQNVVDLPGFTRGLDFVGDFAFIGLSQVRDSAMFSGIEIASRPQEERLCGLCVVNINSGLIVAFLRFDDGVEEVFAVHALRGVRYPELLTALPKLVAGTFDVPYSALADVPRELREGQKPVATT